MSLDLLKTAVEGINSLVDGLHSEIAIWKSECHDRDTEIAELKSEIETLEAENAAFDDASDHWMTEAEQYQAENLMLVSRIEMLQYEIERMKGTNQC